MKIKNCMKYRWKQQNHIFAIDTKNHNGIMLLYWHQLLQIMLQQNSRWKLIKSNFYILYYYKFPMIITSKSMLSMIIISLVFQKVYNISSETNNRDINGFFQTATVTFTSYYSSHNLLYPSGKISSTATFSNTQKNNYRILYHLSSLDFRLTDLSIFLSVSIQTNTQAIFDLQCPDGDKLTAVTLMYMLISYRFPYLQFQSSTLSGTTDSSGDGSINTVISTAYPMQPTSQYMVSYIGLNIAFTSTFFKQQFLFNSNAFWQSNNAINVTINVQGRSSRPFMVNFFVVHWNSTNFDNGFGNYGTFTYQNIYKTYSDKTHNIGLNSSQIAFFSVQKFSQENKFNLGAGISSGVLNVDVQNGDSVNIAYFVVTLLGTTNCTTTLTPYLSNHTCFDTCPTYPIFLGIYDYKCIYCLQECSACISTTECSFCDTALTHRMMNNITHRCLPVMGYYDNGLYIANPCSTGCLNCMNGSFCINCSSNLFLISGFCTDIVGCASVGLIIGSMKCLRCDHSLHYAQLNGGCNCEKGFRYTVDRTCEQICGDGINTSFECDDGNMINGDGCSSSCKRQHGYVCTHGSITSSSQCYYRGSEISLTLSSITKVIDANQALFIFKILPNIPLFSIEEIVKSLDFAADNTSISSYSVDRGVISVIIDYNLAIQNKMGNISININSSHLLAKQLTLKFTIKSDDIALLVYEYSNKGIIIFYIISFIAFCVLGVFIFSLFSHRMIAVQLIHTFQMLFYLIEFDKNRTVIMYQMETLTYVNFNFLYWKNKQSNFYLNLNEYHNKFSSSNLLFSQEILMLIIGISSTLILVNYVIMRKPFRNNTPQRQRYIAFRKLADRVCNIIAFPFAIGFFYLSFSSQMQIRNQRNGNTPVQKYVTCALFIISSVIFFKELINLFANTNKKTAHNHEEKYVGFYLLFTAIIQVTLVLGQNALIFGAPSKIILLYFIFFCWFIIKRPYKHHLDNVGQIINLLLVISWSGWIVLKQSFTTFVNQQFQILFIFIMLPLMATSIILSIFRAVKMIRETMKKQTEIKLEKNKAIEMKEHINPKKIIKNHGLNDLLLPHFRQVENQHQHYSNTDLIEMHLTRFQKRMSSIRKIYQLKDDLHDFI